MTAQYHAQQYARDHNKQMYLWDETSFKLVKLNIIYTYYDDNNIKQIKYSPLYNNDIHWCPLIINNEL